MFGKHWLLDRRVSLAAAGLTLVFYLLTTAGYGYFRDELYYLACGEHLDWGYVDQPPFIALVAWVLRHTIGRSLFALRLLPGVAAALTVYLSARMARFFGGSEFAEGLAALAALVAPVYLVLFSLFTMNGFDVLFCTVIVFLTARVLAGAAPRMWIAVGLVAGIALENKMTPLFLGFGLVVGLVLARRGRHFASPWLWAGGLLAAVIFAPHVWWQVEHGWPTLEFIANAQRTKIAPLDPLGYLAQQVLLMHPLALPIWLAGLWFLLFGERGRAWRPLGWTYLVVLVLMLVQRSKPYYLSALYPMLFAAGAVAVDRVAGAHDRAPLGVLRVGIVVVLLATGALMAPLAKALLPVDTLVQYHRWVPIPTETGERGPSARTWQIFADQFGWPEMVATVARVYQSLPPSDRARACIAANNYGEAGAIDFFGPAHGLPKAISGHNSYFLWGTHGCDGSVVILVGGKRTRAEELFEEVTPGAVLNCRDCMPYEANAPIWICRRFRGNLQQMWPRAKDYG